MRVNRLADILFIVGCLVLGGLMLSNVARGAREPRAATADVLSTDRTYVEFVRPGAARTVVLYVHPSCRYCTESMPFYRRLVDAGRDHRDRVAIRFASNIDRGALNRYLAEHALGDSEAIRQYPPPGITGTPSVFVLDREGRVVASFAGVLSRAQERTLLRELSR
jgi:hypothetical protein